MEPIGLVAATAAYCGAFADEPGRKKAARWLLLTGAALWVAAFVFAFVAAPVD